MQIRTHPSLRGSETAVVRVGFKVKELPEPCSTQLLNNAQNLAGKVLGLTRVPCQGEWIEFHEVFYEVTHVCHTPIAAHRDALVEVRYCHCNQPDIA